MRRWKTHRIQPGEPIPNEPAKRYIMRSGYVVLRWHKDGQILEILEHRFLAGNPIGPVHHRNHKKVDNSPDNLEPVGSPKAHSERHRSVDRTRVVELYRSGLTTLQIAAQLGINHGTVSRVLEAEGQEARIPASYWTQSIDLDRLEQLHKSWMSSYRIATELGCTQGVVMRRIKQLGLKRHPVGRAPVRLSG